MKKSKKLGELLIESNLIDDMQLKSALSYQSEWGGRLGSIIIKKGFVSEQDMVSVLEDQLGVKCISLREFGPPPKDVLSLIRGDIAKKFGIFPVKFEQKTLVIAISDPTDLKTLDDINFMIGVRVKALFAMESDIQEAIEKYYDGKISSDGSGKLDKERFLRKASKAIHLEQSESTSNDTVVNQKEKLDISANHQTKSPKQFQVSQKEIIEGLINLLVQKQVISKEELSDILKKRMKS